MEKAQQEEEEEQWGEGAARWGKEAEVLAMHNRRTRYGEIQAQGLATWAASKPQGLAISSLSISGIAPLAAPLPPCPISLLSATAAHTIVQAAIQLAETPAGEIQPSTPFPSSFV